MKKNFLFPFPTHTYVRMYVKYIYIFKNNSYRQALEGAIEGREKVIASGVQFTRPDDNFAEMIKSDQHMRKVRENLIDEEQKIKASENARRQRELKKFGKKVQVEKVQERQKKRKEVLEKIKVMRKSKILYFNLDINMLM